MSGVAIASAGSVRGAAEGTYERKYEPVEDLPVDLGVVYIPFMGDKWDCTPAEPTVGQYSDLGAVNQHIDQMQGHGISTLMFNYGESTRDFDRIRAFLDAELSSEIPVETMWVIKKIFTRDLDIDKFIDFARESLLSLPNHRTMDGRPLVQLWASNYLPWHDETATRIKEEWGGFPEFAEYLRSGLTVDGTEPFLVSSITDVPDTGLSGDEAVWNRQFDAVTTWFPNPRSDGKSEWEWYVGRAEGDFRVLRDFAESHGMDFIPTVFPGRDERNNTCWGTNPYVPRDPSHLEQMLELANQYKTVDRINIATYNDWVEGHQIEPGTFNGQQYGTAYLDILKKFQHQARQTTSPTNTTLTTTTSPSPNTTATSAQSATSHEQSQQSKEPPATNTTKAEAPGLDILAALTGLGIGAYRRFVSETE